MKNINIYTNYEFISVTPILGTHSLYHSDDDYDSSNRDLSDTSIELD